MLGAKSSNFVNKILSKLKDVREALNTFNAFIHPWMTSQQYQFFFKNVFLNYCFNAYSYLRLDVKQQKCIFEVWWRHKPSFAIAWRHAVISFYWKYCFSSYSRKTIVYNCFHHFALSLKQENEFLRFWWCHNYVTSP